MARLWVAFLQAAPPPARNAAALKALDARYFGGLWGWGVQPGTALMVADSTGGRETGRGLCTLPCAGKPV